MPWVTGPAIKVASIVISQTGSAIVLTRPKNSWPNSLVPFSVRNSESIKRHASYIANWIELLRADDGAFFTAASQAQKAADYLRGLALTEPLLETVA